MPHTHSRADDGGGRVIPSSSARRVPKARRQHWRDPLQRAAPRHRPGPWEPALPARATAAGGGLRRALPKTAPRPQNARPAAISGYAKLGLAKRGPAMRGLAVEARMPGVSATGETAPGERIAAANGVAVSAR